MWKGIRAADIAEGALKTFGRNAVDLFVPFFLVGLVTGGVVALARLLSPVAVPFGVTPSAFFSTPNLSSVSDVEIFFLLEVIILLSTNILQAVLTGGVAYFAVRRFRSEDVSFADAFRAGIRRFPQILVASLIVGLITGGTILVPLYAVLVGFASQNPPLAATGFIAFALAFPIAIYLGVALALYAPVIMFENLDAIESLRRSWELTRRRRGAIFGAQFLVGLLASVIGFVVLVPLRFLNSAAITVADYAVLSGIVGSWSVLVAAVAYDFILRPRMTYYAPPTMPWPAYGPPASAAWGPATPPASPPPSPPPG